MKSGKRRSGWGEPQVVIKRERLRGRHGGVGKLIRHWGEGYVISYANGLYHAVRRDNGAQVHAPDPE